MSAFIGYNSSAGLIVSYESVVVPNNEKMMKRAGNLIEEFKKLVFPQGYQPTANKRVSSITLRCISTQPS